MFNYRFPFIYSLLLLLFAGPLFLLILQSFSIEWNWGSIYPQKFGVSGWKTALSDPALQHSFLLTFLLTLIVVVLNLLIALPAAKALASCEFKGKTIIDTLFFLPILIPVTAISMGLHLSMIRMGLADTWYGVTLVHLIPTLPYTIRVLRSGFERIGVRTEEQGRTLGGGALQNFWYLQWPRLLPSLRAAIFLTVVISVSQYVLTVIIGGGAVPALALIYFPYTSSANASAVSAFSLLFALLPALLMLTLEILLRGSKPKMNRA
ncbi:ABC transporter permease [Alteribacillus sp. HJP-4]|uniref:ABC transporter permease n=1 Tax=Alteribacillus sp. HJP-4 TaxID=2775394 RepID=UPI0035CD35B7